MYDICGTWDCQENLRIGRERRYNLRDEENCDLCFSKFFASRLQPELIDAEVNRRFITPTEPIRFTTDGSTTRAYK